MFWGDCVGWETRENHRRVSMSLFKIISNTRMAPSSGTMIFCSTWSLRTNCSGSASWGDHSLKDKVSMCLRQAVIEDSTDFFLSLALHLVIWISSQAGLNNKLMFSDFVTCCYICYWDWSTDVALLSELAICVGKR